jgi:hypothetical protein
VLGLPIAYLPILKKIDPHVCVRGVEPGPFSFRFPPGCPWERHAPAWLPEPGWSPAFPGEISAVSWPNRTTE